MNQNPQHQHFGGKVSDILSTFHRYSDLGILKLEQLIPSPLTLPSSQ